ncbi:hypothetical protein EXIGLDRAFT_25922 [Exidia glandulosa HHB12029]|uniref:Novel STAND NTPase 1 domain-containing protein n=1 Tax=Exidia glandulosa HHB12029 TaxID=1314781 RepID=A0A165R3C9_EXIGL|nr:hypothetical protein EXIGLDRAFT_25922 [Exidia glandulosa HHB12029]
MSSSTPEKDEKDKKEERRQLIESGLDAAIMTIDFVTEVVPFDMAQNALKSLKVLLTIIRDTMKNKRDFADLADECRDIALILWQASSNVNDGELSKPLISAIEGVQATVDRICYEIEEKGRRSVTVKLFQASADKADIEGWKGDLAKCLQMFNTKLNVIANVNVINMSEMLSEMRSSQLAGTAAAVDAPMRQPPPPKPTLFFGRDELVQQAVQTLQTPKHVAFLGPGGMGKSSLAKAVLSDPAIVKEFRDERYFVAFDDLNSPSLSLSTFFSRLATALGLRPAKSDVQKLVTWQLQSRHAHALIVLDNAETFLHGGQDAGRIAAALDDIAANPSVVLLFTSRSAALPPNLLCESLSIPALAPRAAREAFATIYSAADLDTQAGRIAPLLAELDYHPLSITLLAQAAKQNQWSVSDIEDAWREQRTRILQTQSGPGAGKNQNLAVSIDLTLNSGALKAFRPSALYFLQLVAFFPKGLNRKKLKDLCPKLSDAQNIVAMLCKLSLTYTNGDYVTMLAPIRTHILASHGTSPSDMPLFADLRTFYRSNLKKHGMDESATLTSITPWFAGEGDNVAYLLSYDLNVVSSEKEVDMTKLEECYVDCYFFLKHITLFGQRYRPLEEKLLLLPDHKPRKMLGMASRTNRVIDWRADCLVALGNLAAIDVDPKALELFDAALALKRSLKSDKDKDVSYILSCKGGLLMDMERFGDAKEILEEAGRTKELGVQATVQVRLSLLAAYMGNSEAGRMAAAARNKYGTELRDSGALPGAILYQARISIIHGNDEAARKLLRECVDASKTFSATRTQGEAILLLADIAARQGDEDAALRLVAEAKDVCSERKDHTYTECIASRAAIAVDAGDFETGRAQLLFAFSESFAHYGRGTWAEAYTHYRCGRLELIAGCLHAARRLFKRCLDLADALSDIGLRARTLRALGELELLEEQTDRATRNFNSAKACCESMALDPKRLYYPCPYNFRLPERFGGWAAHLDKTY